jgi:hypothetical protein
MDMNQWIPILSISLFLIPAACSRDHTQDVQTDDLAAAPEASTGNLEVFINNRKYGSTNGCTGDVGKTGELTCGHEGAVSKVKWTRISEPDGQPAYEFIRVFPVSGSHPSRDTAKVEIKDLPTVVFEGDVQKVVLRRTSE